jgi:hypothetical protein
MHQDTISAPPVYITNVSTSPSDTSSLLFVNKNRLPYGKAQIYFEFSSPQFINEDFTQYSYRLHGAMTLPGIFRENLTVFTFAIFGG